MGQRVIRVDGLGETKVLRDAVRPTKRERRGEVKNVDMPAKDRLRQLGYVVRGNKLIKIKGD